MPGGHGASLVQASAPEAAPSLARGPGDSLAAAAQVNSAAGTAAAQGLCALGEPVPRHAGHRVGGGACWTQRAEPLWGRQGRRVRPPPAREKAARIRVRAARTKGACTPRHWGRRPRGPLTQGSLNCHPQGSHVGGPPLGPHCGRPDGKALQRRSAVIDDGKHPAAGRSRVEGRVGPRSRQGITPKLPKERGVRPLRLAPQRGLRVCVAAAPT